MRLLSLSSLLEAIAASAMLTVARVADVNAVKLAVTAVAVESAFGDAAGHAAINFLFHNATSCYQYSPFCKKYDGSR